VSDAYIYDAIRTPRGKGKQDGSLHSVKPISLLTGLMGELQQRHQLDTALVDDVVLGCVTPIGEQGADIAKIAALAAGWDWKVAGVQLNRFCASGLEAVNLAAQKCAPAGKTWWWPAASSPCRACRWAPTAAPGRKIPTSLKPTSSRKASAPT
jgi:acetyl-CoA acetyltransferase